MSAVYTFAGRAFVVYQGKRYETVSAAVSALGFALVASLPRVTLN